ncbi:hypothetical protein [Pseudomonas sp. DSP3-2-2]|uniref:hypothetical protein n=1 Tax=unclassified Pseudomonas TaxID=196821 RepID=UPI003CE966C1
MAAWDDSPIIVPAAARPKATAGIWNEDGADADHAVHQPQPGIASSTPVQNAWEAAPIITPAAQMGGGASSPAGAQDRPWYEKAFSDTEQDVGAGTAALRSAGDGITFGLQDEILAGLDAAAQPLFSIPENGSSADSWRERYDENVANQRAQLKTGQEQHPYASVAGSIAGGVVPALATGGASMAGQTVGRAFTQGAGIGAVYGGLYGAGSAEGDLGQRVPGALQGAALGAVVGGALPAVIGGVRGAANAITSPEMRAQAQLNKALDRDNLTPEQFRQQYDELATQQPGSAIPADAGGENVRGLVERLANSPGQARTTVTDTLTNRQAAQGERLTNTVKSLSGVSRSADAAIDQTMAQRSAEAAPLYAAAHAEEVPWSPQLQGLMGRPAMQTAYRDAQRRAANQGRTFDGQFMEVGADGVVTPRSVPKTKDLDVIKQNLDGQIESLLGSGARSEARDIIGIRNELVGIMDASAPTYAKARAVFAGHSQYMEGIERGADILERKVTPERWASEFARLNPSEQEAVRIGAVSSIISKIGNDAAAMPDVTKYLRSPNGRAKVAAMLPDDASRAIWENSLKHEISVSKLSGRALGNSATARRQAEMDEANGVIGDLVAAGFAGANPATGIMHTLLRSLPRAVGSKINERSNRILAKALTSADGLSALKGVQPRTLVGGVVPAVGGVAAGQYAGSAAAARGAPARNRAARQQREEQAATSGFYPTVMAANAALREASIREGYEAYRPEGSKVWAVRPKREAVELPATIVRP